MFKKASTSAVFLSLNVLLATVPNHAHDTHPSSTQRSWLIPTLAAGSTLLIVGNFLRNNVSPKYGGKIRQQDLDERFQQEITPILEQAKTAADKIADKNGLKSTDKIVAICSQGNPKKNNFMYAFLPANRIYDQLYEPIICKKRVPMIDGYPKLNGESAPVVDITKAVCGYRNQYKATKESFDQRYASEIKRIETQNLSWAKYPLRRLGAWLSWR